MNSLLTLPEIETLQQLQAMQAMTIEGTEEWNVITREMMCILAPAYILTGGEA